MIGRGPIVKNIRRAERSSLGPVAPWNKVRINRILIKVFQLAKKDNWATQSTLEEDVKIARANITVLKLSQQRMGVAIDMENKNNKL